MSSANQRRDAAIRELDSMVNADYDKLAQTRMQEANVLLEKLSGTFPPTDAFFELEDLVYPIVALRRKFDKETPMHTRLTELLKQILARLKELESSILEENPRKLVSESVEEELGQDPTLPGGKRRRTRRKFKMPRKMSRKYCKKTPCTKMGFTQRASCRPWKNCYKNKK